MSVHVGRGKLVADHISVIVKKLNVDATLDVLLPLVGLFVIHELVHLRTAGVGRERRQLELVRHPEHLFVMFKTHYRLHRLLVSLFFIVQVWELKVALRIHRINDWEIYVLSIHGFKIAVSEQRFMEQQECLLLHHLGQEQIHDVHYVCNFELEIGVRKVEFNLEHVLRDLPNLVPLLMVHVRIRNGEHWVVLHLEVVNHFEVPIDDVQNQIVEIVNQGACLKHAPDVLLRKVRLLSQNYEVFNSLVRKVRPLVITQPFKFRSALVRVPDFICNVVRKEEANVLPRNASLILISFIY